MTAGLSGLQYSTWYAAAIPLPTFIYSLLMDSVNLGKVPREVSILFSHAGGTLTTLNKLKMVAHPMYDP